MKKITEILDEFREYFIYGSGDKLDAKTGKKLKFSYQEARDYETIEAEVAELEERIEQIDIEMTKQARDFIKLAELTKEKENVQNILEEKMDRWMYLEELKAKIDGAI